MNATILISNIVVNTNITRHNFIINGSLSHKHMYIVLYTDGSALIASYVFPGKNYTDMLDLLAKLSCTQIRAANSYGMDIIIYFTVSSHPCVIDFEKRG